MSLIHDIDQKNITEFNSAFTINSSYYIDQTNEIDVNQILDGVSFTPSALSKIPYALAQQSYWIKLSLYYPINTPTKMSILLIWIFSVTRMRSFFTPI